MNEVGSRYDRTRSMSEQHARRRHRIASVIERRGRLHTTHRGLFFWYLFRGDFGLFRLHHRLLRHPHKERAGLHDVQYTRLRHWTSTLGGAFLSKLTSLVELCSFSRIVEVMHWGDVYAEGRGWTVIGLVRSRGLDRGCSVRKRDARKRRSLFSS